MTSFIQTMLVPSPSPLLPPPSLQQSLFQRLNGYFGESTQDTAPCVLRARDPPLFLFPRFSKPLSPVSTLQQSESCTRLSVGDFSTAMPAGKRKRGASEDSLVDVLRDSLLGHLTPSPRASPCPPSAWRGDGAAHNDGNLELEFEQVPLTPSPSPSPPPIPRKSPLRSSMPAPRPRNCTVSDDECYLAAGLTQGECLCLSSDEKKMLTRCHCSNSRARGPSRPQRAAKGTSSYQLRQFAEATLGSGSLRKAVKLPEGEDANEWFAVNGPFSRLVTSYD